MRKNLFGLTTGITLMFTAFLLNSCIPPYPYTPMVLALSAQYKNMISSPINDERIIGTVSLEGNNEDFYTYIDGCPSSVSLDTLVVESEKHSGRNPNEVALDKLLHIAQGLYPGEEIKIRNAVKTYKLLGSRPSTMVETIYTCQEVFVADIVVTEPMPAPVTYSVELPLVDVSRDDLYRRIANWLDDKKYAEGRDDAVGVRIESDLSKDIHLGRIKGDYVFYVTLPHGNYRITSTFTIDVHDDKAEITFKDAHEGGAGEKEPIVLQSIANAAQAEIVSFCENLKNSVAR